MNRRSTWRSLDSSHWKPWRQTSWRWANTSPTHGTSVNGWTHPSSMFSVLNRCSCMWKREPRKHRNPGHLCLVNQCGASDRHRRIWTCVEEEVGVDVIHDFLKSKPSVSYVFTSACKYMICEYCFIVMYSIGWWTDQMLHHDNKLLLGFGWTSVFVLDWNEKGYQELAVSL